MIVYKSNESDSNARCLLNLQKSKFLENDDEESTPQQDHESFYEQFDGYLSEILKNNNDKISISNMISFLLKFDKSFYSSNISIIPQIIESGTFEIILSQIDDMDAIIFSLFKNIVHCQSENLILLLQNNFCDELLKVISSMFNYDDEVCRCSIDCLVEIMSRDIFFFVLIFSTNIIQIIFDFLNQIIANFLSKTDLDSIKNNHLKIIYCFIFLSEFFCEGPIPDENISIKKSPISDQYQDFIKNCSNSCIYDFDLFNNFLENGIKMSSSDHLFNQLIELCFSIISNSGDVYLISNYLSIIFYIVYRNTLTAEFLLFRLPFFDYIDKWLENSKYDYVILLPIVKIIGLLFNSEVRIFNDIIENSIEKIIFIFDKFLVIDEELEYEIISTLYHMVEHCGLNSECSRKLVKKKRRRIILNQFLHGSFSNSRIYARLILSIAKNVKQCIKFLTFDVLEKIFSLMEKKKGDFVFYALDSFQFIFEKQKLCRYHKVFDRFSSCSGVDFLYDLLDSTDNDEDDEDIIEINQKINYICEAYFSNKEEEDFDDDNDQDAERVESEEDLDEAEEEDSSNANNNKEEEEEEYLDEEEKQFLNKNQ